MKQIFDMGALACLAVAALLAGCAPEAGSPTQAQYTQWMRMMNKPEREKTDLFAQHLLGGLRSTPEKLELVNSYYNARGGDDEQVAIAKFYLLARLDIPKGSMHLLTVQDMRRGGAMHTLLTVETLWGPYALDNQLDEVTPLDQLTQYVPLFSLNENGWTGYPLPTN